MKPGEIINLPDLPDGVLVRDGEGDYYIRYGMWGHMPFAVGTRPWCGWGERARFPWRPTRGRMEVVALGILEEEATGENLRRLAKAFEQERGTMDVWVPEAILTTATPCEGL